MKIYSLFLRIPSGRSYSSNDKLEITNRLTSDETCSIQTNKGKESIALLAKAWAALLPYRLVWEKEKVLSEPTIDTVSFTISPMDEWRQSEAYNAL